MLLKINGHLQHFPGDRIQALTKVGPGKYRLETTIGTYSIEGGRHAGGRRQDWYLGPIGETAIFRRAEKTIFCMSLVDAVKIVAGA